MRVGLGYDAHPLVEGRPLMLGGVRIPFPRGLLGHSDGDVLLHALADALLGAAGLGDIGTHFPPDDPRFAGAPSALFLREVARLLASRRWRVVNLDATIVAERPALRPFIPGMREQVARHLGIPPEAVSIKAKSTNGLGFEGRGEGISAYAVALLREEDAAPV